MNLFASLALFGLMACALGACGPAEWITETPGVTRAARPADCDLGFITLGPKDLVPSGPYELLGYITLARDAPQDPASAEARAKVRRRACRMGGEALATWDFKVSRSGDHTEIDYAVVRKAQPTAGDALAPR